MGRHSIWVVLATAVSLLMGCERVEDISDVPGAITVKGRCVELLQQMGMVDSGGSKVAPFYLSPSPDSLGSPSTVRMMAAPGEKFTIRSVLIETTAEDRQVHVVGEQQDNQPIALTLLFRPAWLNAIRQAERRRSIENIPLSDALDPQLARWCGDFGQKMR